MPKFSVLIIEDEKNIQTFMGKVLKRHDYRVLSADTGAQGLELIRSQCPDIVLLDLGLPDMNGDNIIREVRTWTSTPIIVISARTAEREKVLALDLGADDYITKPFLPQELLLRLRAVLRRVYREKPSTPKLGDTEIDWGKGTVRRDGEEIALTAKEFALLKKLWEARGNIVTIDALCAALWDGPLVGYENTLMVHIRRLREKVEADPSHPKFLLTVRGLGYRLKREELP